MTQDEMLKHIKRLLAKTKADDTVIGIHSEVIEFLRAAVGPKSAFLSIIDKYGPYGQSRDWTARNITSSLTALRDSVTSGAHKGVSPKRQAEIDVVSDFLAMAQQLLETHGVHPAAPAVLIGATLEEFLRTWCEAENLTLGNKKPGLETYSQTLRDADLITKQDGKDITAWAGVRNHAAHGEWEDVGGKERLRLILEGVNLFMRKYSPEQ